MGSKQWRLAHLAIAVTFFTSGLIINLIQFLLHIAVRPISRRLYRKLNYYPTYSFFSQVVYLVEWWSGSDLVLYIDKSEFANFGNEHAYALLNHTYEVDWMIGWLLCDRIGVLGNCKAYIRKPFHLIPTVGWAWSLSESIFLDRAWDKDKQVIGTQIEELTNYPDPIFLLLYPEGTRFTPKKLEASQEFAKKKDLPILKHHLTPRTKGFTASVPHMRGKIDALYDIQLAFEQNSPVSPTLMSLLNGKRVVGHMYVRRIPLDEIPEDEDDAARWLHELYQKKDRLADSFAETGDFFATSGVPKVESFKLERRYWSLLNSVFWAVAILLPVFYNLVSFLLVGSITNISIVAGVIGVVFFLLQRIIGLTQISSSTTYGTKETKKSD